MVRNYLSIHRALDKDIKETIENDYNTIDLEKTLRTIPDLGNEHNLFLRDLKDFKFSSDLFYDVVSNTIKTSREAKETYVLYAGVPAYEKLRQMVYDYYNYGINNCLIVDRYRENNEIFEIYIRSILASVSASDYSTTDEAIFGWSGNIHADSINAEDIQLIIRYIDVNKLRKLFSEFSIKTIEVDSSGNDYLESLIGNISSAFDLRSRRGIEFFWRFICLVSHTRVNKEMATSKSRKIPLKDHRVTVPS